MIVFLVRRRHRYTIDLFVSSHAHELSCDFRVLPYEHAFGARSLPAGTYVFSDVERLDAADQVRAAVMWKALTEAPGTRVLNHPVRSMRRYELLRTLYERGYNDFDVVRPSEARLPKRYPVFLRGENDHGSTQNRLLETPEALHEALEAWVREGGSLDGRLIVEYAGRPGRDGLHRKYAAFAVGERVIARHVFFDPRWHVVAPKELGPEHLEEELRYVRENPHADRLREIFRLARIDYGRIDYDVVDGRIQTWEINTNPNTVGDDGMPRGRTPAHEVFARGFLAAWEAVDMPDTGARVAIPWPRAPLAALGEWVREHASDAFRWTALTRLEPKIRARVYRAWWAGGYHRWLRKRRGRGQARDENSPSAS